MNKYQHIIGRAQYIVFLAFLALLPFPQVLLRYACVLWLLLWFMEGRWLSRANLNLQPTRYRLAIPFLLFGLWFGYKLLSGLWAGNTEAWSAQIERYLSFGLLIPVGLWGVNEQYDWRQAGRVLVISCVAAVPLYILWLAALYFHPDWVQYLSLSEPWTYHSNWWVFLSENISQFKHRLYFCSVELFGAIVANFVYRKRLIVLIPALLIMLSTIPLTASRQSILTCAALVAVGMIYALPSRYRLRYGIGILLLGIVIGGGVLMLHPRMQAFNFQAITEIRNISYTHDVRFNIWGTALQHPKDYIEHGLGAGQSWVYLMEQYKQVGLDYYAEVHYNCHNQYLEELMEGGIIGLVLFLTAWLSLLIGSYPKTREMAWLVVLLFMMNMTTECVFGRFDGVALWLGSMLLLLIYHTRVGLKTDTQGKQ